MAAMGTKSREIIWGSTIRGAKMSAETARQRAREAARKADHAEATRWRATAGPRSRRRRSGNA
jgi:hypothetical protein